MGEASHLHNPHATSEDCAHEAREYRSCYYSSSAVNTKEALLEGVHVGSQLLHSRIRRPSWLTSGLLHSSHDSAPGPGWAADRPWRPLSYHRYIEYGRLLSESRPRIWQSVVTEVETTDPEAPAQKEVRCCSLVTLSTSSYMCGGASSPADTKPHAAAPHPKRAGQYMQSSCAKPHPLRGL